MKYAYIEGYNDLVSHCDHCPYYSQQINTINNMEESLACYCGAHKFIIAYGDSCFNKEIPNRCLFLLTEGEAIKKIVEKYRNISLFSTSVTGHETVFTSMDRKLEVYVEGQMEVLTTLNELIKREKIKKISYRGRDTTLGKSFTPEEIKELKE